MKGRASVIADEAHWRDLRSRHVGGSEVAALFGEHAQLTRFELWHQKRGTLSTPDLDGNERVFWGSILEPAIASGIAERTGWTTRKVRRYYSGRPDLALGGSLDYEIIAHDRGPGVLEIKCADRLVVRDWEDGEPPLSYELQLQSYLALTGRAWGAIGVLIGGNDLRIFEYERRPKTIAAIENAVREFWASVDAGIEPKPDFADDGAAIARLYSAVAPGKTIDLSTSNRLPELVAQYRDAGAAEKAAKTARDAAKAEILTLIGDAETVICGDARISAKQVAGGHVEYDRAAYRDFRIHMKKAKAA